MSGGFQPDPDAAPRPDTREFIQNLSVETPDRTEALTEADRRIAAGLPGLRPRGPLAPEERFTWYPVET